jgi:hypothetical protein
MAPQDLLLPGGEPIGTPSQGGDETVRNVLGGPEAAQQIYDQLSQGGIPHNGNYPGTAVELPGGGFVGIRNMDSSNPTIDVNIPGVPRVRKLHF